MAENGVKTTFLDPVSTIDSVIGNKDGNTSLVPLTDFARQLLGLGIEGTEEWLLAQKWAENPEDVAVLPGQFSSLHHAKKSEISKEIATAQANLSTSQAVVSTNQAVLAQGYADAAQIAAALAATGINLKGNWSSASGSFPAGTIKGDAYIVNVAGTVGGEPFGVGDWLISMVDGASTGVYLGNWVRADYSQIALSEFYGTIAFATNGGRIGITSDGVPIVPTSLLQIVNKHISTGLRCSSYWQGSAAAPFQNHDNSLWEVYTKVLDDSINYAWTISGPNSYHHIPFGVRDGGDRTSLYGWSTIVNIPGEYEVAGTLGRQVGVKGRVGWQGQGHPVTGVVEVAIGVKGEVFSESVGPTIENAFAGHFTSVDPNGTILNNTAVYAEAAGGDFSNWVFFGARGDLFVRDRSHFGEGSAVVRQSDCAMSARGDAANALEFGNADPSGYGSNIGATAGSGIPFIALCAEADPAGNTFKTRGKKGVAITSLLDGSMVFNRLPDANAAGQDLVESMRLTDTGRLVVASSVKPATYTVATVPSAAAHDVGALINVSDEVGGFVPAFSDGTNWLRMTDRTVIS